MTNRPGPSGDDQGEALLDANAGAITQLLERAAAGDESAFDAALPLVYDLLREQARRALHRETSGHTLDATALVHEAWMRLARQREARYADSGHFLATAALVMRRILVSHARAKRRLKRGGGADAVVIDAALADTIAEPDAGPAAVDLVALDEALVRLAAHDPRLVHTVELRYFAGLSVEEAAGILGVGTATVKRDWAFAKAWLRDALADPAGESR